jgi:uncharacterized membrane protein (DUF2068 family)
MTDLRQSGAVPPTHVVARRRALRAIAIFEAVKGVAVFAASIGLLSLMHRDVRHIAAELIEHFGMHLGKRFPPILLHYADVLYDANLRWLLFAATCYITVRLFEAYGLWHDFIWAEWLGALSGVLYIPFEVRHFLLRTSGASAAVLLGNIFVIGFLVFQLWRRRRQSASEDAQ